MIKAILIDLDNTLVSTGEIHFHSLNKALQEVSPEHVISRGEHLEIYNGLPTKRKLELLRDNRGLSPILFPLINEKKQKYTEILVKELIKPTDYVPQKECLSKLRADGYQLACCSNAIRSSVYNMLLCSVGTKPFNKIYSNEDVEFPKPSPSMYLLAMAELGVSPKETLIIEDSDVGIASAKASCANVMRVNGPQDIIYEDIVEFAKLAYLKRL